MNRSDLGILFVALVLMSLHGCAGLQPHVNYTVLLPGKVLANVNTIAIFDFAVPLNEDRYGQRFAETLHSLFLEKSNYRMVELGQSRGLLQQQNIPLSRFRDLEVVRDIGGKLGAHALLFGDLHIPGVQSFEKMEKTMQQVGVRRELESRIDAAGNTVTFWIEIPLYEEISHHTITRLASVQAKARLIRVDDGKVLWEGTAEDQAIDEFSFTGDRRLQSPRSEENLNREALQRAASQLLGDLLPRRVIRYRQLAEVSGNDSYGVMIREGNRAAQANDWQSAGRYWLKAYALDPLRPEAYANLGILHEGAQNFTEAEHYLAFAAQKMGYPWDIYLEELRKTTH